MVQGPLPYMYLLGFQNYSNSFLEFSMQQTMKRSLIKYGVLQRALTFDGGRKNSICCPTFVIVFLSGISVKCIILVKAHL